MPMQGKAKAVNAPVGGWNARDSLDDMAPEDAVILDNWLPTTDGVELRGGYNVHVSGFPGQVETLAEYHSATLRKLIAASGTKVFDASTSLTEIGTGFTNAQWQTAMQKSNLVMVNGEDQPQFFDGATLAPCVFSGSTGTPTTYIGVGNFGGRLWYFEEESQTVRYTAIGAFQGALTAFELGEITTLGGKLTAIGTWTRDSGEGLNDIIVFIFSSGDCILYQGDPAVNFQQLGVFRIGEPLSNRCLEDYGANLVIMTRDGYIDILSVLQFGESVYDHALSDKIRGAVTQATRSFGPRFGWEALFYPRGHRILFNVPLGNDVYEQHVVNTITGAWSRLKGVNGNTFVLFDDELYFGGDTEILATDNVQGDKGQNVVADAQTAYNYLGDRTHLKQFTMIRPVVKGTGFPGDPVRLGTDFDAPEDPPDPIVPNNATTVWGSPWGSPWGASSSVEKEFIGVGDIGYNVSMRFKISAKKRFQWFSTEYLYKPGGVL